MAASEARPWAASLNGELVLTSAQQHFFGDATGLQDVDQLKAHIRQVQSDALAVKPYRCIEAFAFLDFRASTLPAYQRALELGKRDDALFVDCGCFAGTDVRKAIADGWPEDRIIGTDLEPEFVSIGRRLFGERADAKTPAFLAGDLFSSDFLDTDAPSSSATTPLPLHHLTTLTPLRGKATVVCAGSLFHLFDRSKQEALARRLLPLLSSQSGSVIMGGQVGVEAEEGWEGAMTTPRADEEGAKRFLHSPQTWRQMWHDLDPAVRVEAELDLHASLGRSGPRGHRIMWSVTRVSS